MTTPTVREQVESFLRKTGLNADDLPGMWETSDMAGGWADTEDGASGGQEVSYEFRELDRQWSKRYAALAAKLELIRREATKWAALAPDGDWGDTPMQTGQADIGRYLLRIVDGDA